MTYYHVIIVTKSLKYQLKYPKGTELTRTKSSFFMLCEITIFIHMLKIRSFQAVSQKLWPNVRYADTLIMSYTLCFLQYESSKAKRSAKMDHFRLFIAVWAIAMSKWTIVNILFGSFIAESIRWLGTHIQYRFWFIHFDFDSMSHQKQNVMPKLTFFDCSSPFYTIGIPKWNFEYIILVIKIEKYTIIEEHV